MSDIIETIEKQQFIDPNILMEHFWNVFVADAFLGNFDRHNGNWGFLYDGRTQSAEISPVYDCGSCLLPQADERTMKLVLNDVDEMNTRVFNFPTSAIKLGGKKINYYDFLNNGDFEDCSKAIKRIVPKIDMTKISKFIESIPYLNQLQKEFYVKYIDSRYEKIIMPAYEQVLEEMHVEEQDLDEEQGMNMQ